MNKEQILRDANATYDTLWERQKLLRSQSVQCNKIDPFVMQGWVLSSFASALFRQLLELHYYMINIIETM